MAAFIRLTRSGPPPTEVLVNLDSILLAQPKHGGGSSILFGKEHVISFVDDIETIERLIAHGPWVMSNHA